MVQYRDMLRQVNIWTPPTTDHVELRDFMIQQIEDSIEHDGMGDYYDKNPIIVKTGNQWLISQKASAEWDVNYHAEELGKEAERARDRTQWVGDLRNSLLCESFNTPVCNTCEKRFKCFTIRNYRR